MTQQEADDWCAKHAYKEVRDDGLVIIYAILPDGQRLATSLDPQNGFNVEVRERACRYVLAKGYHEHINGKRIKVVLK